MSERLEAAAVDDSGCLPDPARARRLNRLMRSALGDSIGYVCGEIAGRLAFDAAGVGAVADGLRAGRSFGFPAFLHYYDLVPALTESRSEAARDALAAIAALEPREAGLEVASIGGGALAPLAARIRGALDTDPEVSFGFRDVGDDVVEQFRDRLAQAMSLLRRATPALAEELDELVETLILARGEPGAPLQFDGASAYRLWGVLVLNADFHQTPVQLAEAIAHESGHLILFGLTTEQPLTFNDPAETFASPLRQDARPMDGIVHATFVSARMHWAMTELAASGALDAQESAAAEAAAREDAANFRRGYEIITRHAKLSPVGRAAMEACTAYMARARVEEGVQFDGG